MTRTRVAARSRQAKDRRRSEMVEAARALFLRKGFAAGSMNDLARDLNVAKGTLYVYFRGKSELLVAVMRSLFEELTAGWQSILERRGPAPERLEALARAGLSMLEQDLDTCVLLMRLWGATGEPFGVDLATWMRQTYADYRAAIAEIVRSGIHAGEIRRSVDPERAASLFIAILDGLTIQWIAAPGLFDVESLMETFRRVFFEGLQEDAR